MQASIATEIGLKTQIKRQVGLKKYEEQVGDYHKVHLIKAWKAMESAGLDDAVSDMIWDYVSSPMGQTYARLSSDQLGLLSVIKPYTNKAGKVSLAHFSTHGWYLGSVAKMGDKPVPYPGYFIINSNQFVLELDKIATLSDEVQTGNIRVKISFNEMIGSLFTTRPGLAITTCTTERVPDSDDDSDDEDVPIGQIKRK